MSATSPAADAPPAPAALAPLLLRWFDQHGRHDLPWQQPRTPYRVWLSEIMLQQTQVAVARAYFERFVAALPDLPALARASEDTVLALWSGLGYYSRARNLHRAARLCMERHAGELPASHEALLALPGIGRSTAGAIQAMAFGQRAAILDGNVRRVLARLHGVHGWPGERSVETRLWHLSELHLPHSRLPDYTQALMDFGATRCTRSRPACHGCPLAGCCSAVQQGMVALLPTPRPVRPLPTREASMLVVLDGQARVLLERRPGSGVWGGLWSLPEAAGPDALQDWLKRLQLQAGAAAPVAGFEHAFTHFRLRVQALCWTDASIDRSVGEPALQWYAAGQLAELGIPAPVRRLLQRVLTAQATPAC